MLSARLKNQRRAQREGTRCQNSRGLQLRHVYLLSETARGASFDGLVKVSSCARPRAASRSPANRTKASGVSASRALRAINTSCDGEEIFDAVVHLPEQEILPLLGTFALADVTGDFRCANDLPICIFDWRPSQWTGRQRAHGRSRAQERGGEPEHHTLQRGKPRE
jgi:hypothetical protein